MNGSKRTLSREAERLLSTNPQPLPEGVLRKMSDLLSYESDLSEWRVDAERLKKSFLTPTLLYVAKTEALIQSARAAWLRTFAVRMRFAGGVNFWEFFEYFRFRNDESATIETVLEDTTTLFRKRWLSESDPWLHLFHHEIYEHEDDTDEWEYFIVLASVGKSGFSDTMPADSNPPEWNTP